LVGGVVSTPAADGGPRQGAPRRSGVKEKAPWDWACRCRTAERKECSTSIAAPVAWSTSWAKVFYDHRPDPPARQLGEVDACC
jgi:hypothetical protein